MAYNIKRSICVLCGNAKIEEFYEIKNMPSFMGVVDSNFGKHMKNNLIVGECSNCGLIQNIDLLDPSLVYLNNHNTEVVGEIWEEHYVELCDFIKKNTNGGIVLEIGDPSAKIAKNLKSDFNKWIIIEPNTELIDFDNVKIIKNFFNGEKPTSDEYDVIVHSHVLEHIYDPIKFLNDCNLILKDGCSTIFSIPNIKWILENNGLPTSVLHFEHTYYIDDENINIFLSRAGFQVDEIYYYKNHSIFIKATKKNSIDKQFKFNKKLSLKGQFLKTVNYYKEKINQINKKLEDKEYYLYSAHINSQFMLNCGISKNIIGLLDKSKSKIGKKLYGYNYDIFPPNKISIENNPIVVTTHMGAYYEEIKNNLLNINPNTIIL